MLIFYDCDPKERIEYRKTAVISSRLFFSSNATKLRFFSQCSPEQDIIDDSLVHFIF